MGILSGKTKETPITFQQVIRVNLNFKQQNTLPAGNEYFCNEKYYIEHKFINIPSTSIRNIGFSYFNFRHINSSRMK